MPFQGFRADFNPPKKESKSARNPQKRHNAIEPNKINSTILIYYKTQSYSGGLTFILRNEFKVQYCFSFGMFSEKLSENTATCSASKENFKIRVIRFIAIYLPLLTIGTKNIVKNLKSTKTSCFYFSFSNKIP